MDVEMCNLKGQNEQTLRIQVLQFVEQSQNDELGDIEPGTMIVCRRYFPVVDFFIHTLSGLKLFIQLSESKYQNHLKKLPDLFKSKVSPGDDKSGKETVFEYFYSRSKGSLRKRNSSPNDCLYLYITTIPSAEACQRSCKGAHAGVRLICKDHLERLGNLWQISSLYARH